MFATARTEPRPPGVHSATLALGNHKGAKPCRGPGRRPAPTGDGQHGYRPLLVALILDQRDYTSVLHEIMEATLWALVQRSMFNVQRLMKVSLPCYSYVDL